MKRRILVATDGSEPADRAVDYAAGLAKRENADLLIAHVIGGYGLPDGLFARVIEAKQASLKEMLDSMSAQTLTNARERARAAGADSIQLESRAGEVAEAVLDIAKERAVNAIVVQARRRSLRAASARQRVAQACQPRSRAGDRGSIELLRARERVRQHPADSQGGLHV
jgi:nucleotide-binding universal stress UspA family protein